MRMMRTPCSYAFSIAGKVGAAVLLASAMTFAVPQPAVAASSGVPFTGTITTANQCVITLIRNGGFGFSADRMQMSSKLAAGYSGQAEVQSNHAYTVTAEAVPVFGIFPSGGNTNVTFAARFAGTSIFNGRTFAERPGSNGVVLRNGRSRTLLDVHLTATRTGSPFPTGNYQGTVIIRCE